MSPKKLSPVGGPPNAIKVSFLPSSLERARRRDRRINECPHAPTPVDTPSFLTPPRNKQHLPSSTHFFFPLVGRRNLPPLRSNWTEARRRNCSQHTHSRPNTRVEEALQWAITSLWKSCHCSTSPKPFPFFFSSFTLAQYPSALYLAHMQCLNPRLHFNF